MPNHVFLVAFNVESDADRSEVERMLRAELPRPGVVVESWWVAEDDRHDGSDNDSAVFVHPGAQEAASRLLHENGLTADCNLVYGDRRNPWEYEN